MNTQALVTSLLLMSFSTASAREALSAPAADDTFAPIVAPETAILDLGIMSVNGLMSGFSAHEPWAASYWPIHKGLLGYRYSDPDFPKSKTFMTNYSYYQNHPSEVYLAAGQMKMLSPAEKYDLLVGDPNWTLTRANWRKGVDDYEQNGVVATWTGICHGWSAAAHIGTPAPFSAVNATDVTGSYSIHFYPHDIKALVSLLWAQNSPATRKVGNRCRQSIPSWDPNGRPTDPSCLDTNPMNWHTTLINRIGVQKKTLVMDASAGAEVWNYPIIGYDYHYFNPSTLEPSHQLSASLVAVDQFRADRYAATRSPEARFVVGIIMDLYHPPLVEPNTGVTKTNVWTSKRFIYDLELDQNLRVIGGEWYGKDRPDFTWTFDDNAVAETREDRSVGEVTWNPSTALPPALAQAAVSASGRREVLAHIVNALWSASLADISLPPSP